MKKAKQSKQNKIKQDKFKKKQSSKKKVKNERKRREKVGFNVIKIWSHKESVRLSVRLSLLFFLIREININLNFSTPCHKTSMHEKRTEKYKTKQNKTEQVGS
jgi:hypothetical protein